jgi:hypothetical protein
MLTNNRLQVNADQARAQRLPLANASVSQTFNWNNNPDSPGTGWTGTNGTNYSVSSGITVYDGSRVSNSIKQSELDLEGGQYSLETTKESISLNILNAFLQVLCAEEQVKNAAKQIESPEEQLQLAKERLALKIIATSDLAQVKSQLATDFDKYALEGYKPEIVDYLLKPFGYEEFLTAVKKEQRLIGLEQKDQIKVEVNNEFLFLKSDYKIKAPRQQVYACA